MTIDPDELCPYCNKPLFGVGKTLTSNIGEQTVHLECEIASPEELEILRRI